MKTEGLTLAAGKKEISDQSVGVLMNIWTYLGSKRKNQLRLLLLLMVCSGVLEMISLGALLPFLEGLTNPKGLYNYPFIRELTDFAGIKEAEGLLIPLTLLFVGFVIVSALTRLTNLWLNSRMSAAVGSDLSCEAYKRILYQPYEMHITRNSATLINSLTNNLLKTVEAIRAAMQVITSTVVMTGIVVCLLIINWKIAIGGMLFFGTTYLLMALTVQKKLMFNSKIVGASSRMQIKALQEGLGAIRDVILDGTQNTYLNEYRVADWPQRQLTANNTFLGAFPKHAIEPIGLLIIALVSGVVAQSEGNGAKVIPLLGTFALGVQKLLPTLQQIFRSWSVIKGSYSNQVAVVEILEQPFKEQNLTARRVRFQKGLELKDINFKYGHGQPTIIKGLDLRIRPGERVGVIGSTGSGKSTLVDLIMGLLTPTGGQMLIDGQDLHSPDNPELLTGWRAGIAHVPQSVYLSDGSIAENIAFGLTESEIDMGRVRKAANQAQIAGFIESSSEGYSARVGERGIKLSGGQRQRIGIARALYKEVNILVLDEATSALDTQTEEAVMRAVNKLNKDLTIIIIAHRLSTVQKCDRVIELREGLIAADGTPQQVLT